MRVCLALFVVSSVACEAQSEANGSATTPDEALGSATTMADLHGLSCPVPATRGRMTPCPDGEECDAAILQIACPFIAGPAPMIIVVGHGRDWATPQALEPGFLMKGDPANAKAATQALLDLTGVPGAGLPAARFPSECTANDVPSGTETPGWSFEENGVRFMSGGQIEHLGCAGGEDGVWGPVGRVQLAVTDTCPSAIVNSPDWSVLATPDAPRVLETAQFGVSVAWSGDVGTLRAALAATGYKGDF